MRGYSILLSVTLLLVSLRPAYAQMTPSQPLEVPMGHSAYSAAFGIALRYPKSLAHKLMVAKVLAGYPDIDAMGRRPLTPGDFALIVQTTLPRFKNDTLDDYGVLSITGDLAQLIDSFQDELLALGETPDSLKQMQALLTNARREAFRRFDSDLRPREGGPQPQNEPSRALSWLIRSGPLGLRIPGDGGPLQFGNRYSPERYVPNSLTGQKLLSTQLGEIQAEVQYRPRTARKRPQTPQPQRALPHTRGYE